MNDVFDPLIGDTILVFYERTNCYYEAKVTEKRYDNISKKPEYRVHYSGWNKRWDEWVKSEKILKVTPKNVEAYGAVMNIRKRKRTLSEIKNDTIRMSENKSGKRQMKDDEKDSENERTAQHMRNMSSTASPMSCNDASNDSDPSHGEEHKTKRRRRSRASSKGRDRSIAVEGKQERGNEDRSKEGHTLEVKHGHGNLSNYVDVIPPSSYRHHRDDDDDDKNAIDIYLPIELKKKLITDWENITKHHKLMKLPRENGQRVVDILNHYCESSKDSQINKDVVRGLKDYFDQALEVTLLYKFERPLHHSILRQYPHLKMSQIYGVEHLCRLFVKLPHLLGPSDLDQPTRMTLEREIKNIIDLILNFSEKYFTEEYQIPNEEYVRSAEHVETENLT